MGLAGADGRSSWDVQIEIMELPYLLRLEPSELPVATEYLRVPPNVRATGTRCDGAK